jgi:hypothetical protein
MARHLHCVRLVLFGSQSVIVCNILFLRPLFSTARCVQWFSVFQLEVLKFSCATAFLHFHLVPFRADNKFSIFLHSSTGLFYSFYSSSHASCFLVAFVKLRKTTVSFIMSVRLSTRNSSVSFGRVLMKFNIWALFENLLRKFNFRWNPTRITGTLHEEVFTFTTVSRWILHKMKKSFR